MKNKKWLKRLWDIYAAIGAIFLTFGLIGHFFLHKQTKHNISGVVKEIIETEWKGFKDINAIVETSDGQGNVFVTVYKPGLESGDEVNLEISTSDQSKGYIYSSIK